MSQLKNERSFWRRFFFSEFLEKKSAGGKIAYLSVSAALMIAANMLEFRMMDTQFSLTLFFSALAGILLGAGSGFAVCFLADFLGFLYSSWGYIYMVWVGLTVSCTALIFGCVFTYFRPKFKGGIFVQTAIACLLSFFICTVGINSTGFYLYNLEMGFSTAVVEYVSKTFGTGVSYFGYVAYRLIFKMQILNNVLNYAVLFLVLPILKIRMKNVFAVEKD